MPTFLLWNVRRKPLEGILARLVQEHDIDVVVLVESAAEPSTVIPALRVVGSYTQIPSHERFGVYTRLDETRFERFSPLVPDDRMDFWRFRLTRGLDIILAAVHGLDRINFEDNDRTLFFQRLTERINDLESQAGHKRTAIVGDFNANPFEVSVGSVLGLHSIAVRDVGGRHSRIVRGQEYEFFYNPMWVCYGRGRDRPPATYYFNASSTHEIFWHMLDQVMLRPSLLPFFPESRLRILSRAGPIRLLNRAGFPDQTNASDHLPVLFHLSQRRRTTHGRKPVA